MPFSASVLFTPPVSPCFPLLPLPLFSCPDCSSACSSQWVPVVTEKAPRQKTISINYSRAGKMLWLEKSSSRRMAPLLGAGLTSLGLCARTRACARACVYSACPPPPPPDMLKRQ